MTNPFKLQEQAAQGEYTAETLAWFQDAMRKIQLEQASPAVALGLTGANRIRRRNDALRHAARILANGESISNWQLAEKLRVAWRRFCANELARLRGGEQRLPHSDLSREFWIAAQSGATRIGTRESLWRMLEASD